MSQISEVLYHLDFQEADGSGRIEEFISRNPFPTFLQGQSILLNEHVHSLRYVWRSVIEIGHTPDQRELHVRTILTLGREPSETRTED